MRGPKHVVKKGKTPVLLADEARQFLDSIDTGSIVGLRDRAVIGVMVYSFARISATVKMNVSDYFVEGRRRKFWLHEKGGKPHDVPCHHNAVDYLEAYLDAAGIRDETKGPLFRTVDRNRQLTLNRMHRNDALRMIKRRAAKAGLSSNICCHSACRSSCMRSVRPSGLLPSPGGALVPTMCHWPKTQTNTGKGEY